MGKARETERGNAAEKERRRRKRERDTRTQIPRYESDVAKKSVGCTSLLAPFSYETRRVWARARTIRETHTHIPRYKRERHTSQGQQTSGKFPKVQKRCTQ